MHGFNRMAVLAVAASVALAACDDGPSGPDTDEADFAIVMQPEAGGLAALRGPTVVPTDPSAARVSLDVVESIILPIGEVEARTADGGDWIDAGSINAEVDLLSLPEDGITLLDSTLPQGSYRALRFFLTDGATITLSEDVRVGRTLYEAGTHPLEIPSADQNGVRLRADFVVDEGGEVLTILFDGDATVRRVTATGSGTLKIATELRVENEDGEDVGGIDDDEDADDDDGDDDGEVEAEGLVAAVTETGFTFESGTAVVITAETDLEGDLLSLEAVAEALANGEEVEAEAEGVMDDDGSTIVADEVKFEVDDDDGDGDIDDDDDGEVEVEGVVTSVDRSSTSFVIGGEGGTTVLVTDDTNVEEDGDFETFEAMADAFDAGTEIRAEAEGALDDEGRLVAFDVKFETDSDDDDDDSDDDS